MNKQELTDIIISPDLITEKDLLDLEELTKKHPYSSVFSILLLSGLSNNGNFRFDEELANHAFKIQDRTRLYELTLENEKSIAEKDQHSSQEKNLSTDKTNGLNVDNQSFNAKNKSTDQENNIINTHQQNSNTLNLDDQENGFNTVNQTIEPGNESLADNNNKELGEEKNGFTTVNENIIEKTDSPKEVDNINNLPEEVKTPIVLDTNKTSENDEIGVTSLANKSTIETTNSAPEEEAVDSEFSKLDPLSIDILASAVSRSLENEVEQSSEKVDLPKIKLASYSLEDEMEQQNVVSKEENLIKVEAKSTKKEETPSSFMAFLKAHQSITKKPIVSPKKQETKAIESENKVIKEENFNTPSKKIDAIVEKFITEEPQISRPKKEFFSPSKIGKSSLDESALPVSETLAKIFVIQGNYPRAIESYKQLMLNFPEKKSFFANQIKNLQEKLNNK